MGALGVWGVHGYLPRLAWLVWDKALLVVSARITLACVHESGWLDGLIYECCNAEHDVWVLLTRYTSAPCDKIHWWWR